MSAEPTTPTPIAPSSAADNDNEHAVINSLLFRAVRDNQGAMVEYMVNAYPGMQFRETDTNQSLLHAAIEANAVNAVRALLNVGHHVNALNKNGETPLFLAVRNKAVNIVSMLLRRDAFVNIIDLFGNTPLHEAAITAQPDIAKMLILRGADINKKNFDHFSPLFFAVRSQCLPLIEMLLEHGADTNGPGEMAHACKRLLLPAVRENQLAALTFLLHASNVNLATDDAGQMLLYVAASKNAVTIMRMLIEAGANVNDTSNVNGETPLMAAVRFNATEAMAFLFEKGADIHMKDEDGHTVLHLATMMGRDVSVLLDQGARVDEKTASDETAVFLAVRHRQANALNTLLARGASANIANVNGITPILLALTSTYPTPPATITALLRHGATSNIHKMLESVTDVDLMNRMVSRFTISSLQVVTHFHQTRLLQQEQPEHDAPRTNKRARDDQEDEDDVVVVSSSMTCKICIMRDIQVTLAPCGHRALCKECVKEVIGGPCPFCRSTVVTFIEKTFDV